MPNCLYGGSFESEFHEKLLKFGWSRCLSELSQYSEEQQRVILEKALLAFSGDIPPREAERQENFNKAQSAMLARPDHAKYYQDQIETMRRRYQECASLSEEEQERLIAEKTWIGLGDYRAVRRDAFPILSLLPSPETVAVLGHFLEDPEDLRPKVEPPGQDYALYPPNFAAASIALSNLGIEDPPVKEKAPGPRSGWFTMENVEAWRNWWSEVKSGRRTYRFIGSPVEYGPNGPSSRTGSGGSRIHAKEQHPDAVEGNASSKRALFSLVLAGIAALAAALVWYFRKSARTSGAKP